MRGGGARLRERHVQRVARARLLELGHAAQPLGHRLELLLAAVLGELGGFGVLRDELLVLGVQQLAETIKPILGVTGSALFVGASSLAAISEANAGKARRKSESQEEE